MKKTLFAISATVALAMFPQIGAADTIIAKLSAQVPVGFRVARADMPQGDYRLIVSSMASGAPMVTFTHKGTNQHVMAGAHRSGAAKESTSTMQLRCIDRECDVASITARGQKWTFVPRRLSPEQVKRLYTKVISVNTSERAD